MYKVEAFKKEDYDNLLEFLSNVFECLGDHSFDKFLPSMWHRSDEIMGKNFGIKKDGKIIAVMGVYPLRVNVCGKELLFATTGNVAVDPEYRNLGLMKLLMEHAFKELEAQGIDGARLGGERIRYNRYGYEYLGLTNSFVLTAKNLKAVPECTEYLFKCLTKDDTEALSFIKKLHTSKSFYIDRGDEANTFDVMSSFYSSVYLAIDTDGKPCGAISVSEDNDRIYDYLGIDAKTEFGILCCWLKQSGLNKLYFNSPAWTNEFNMLASAVCEQTTTEYTTQCRITNWVDVCNAFTQLKSSYSEPLTKESVIIEIQGYGTLEFNTKGVTKTDKKPDLVLDSLTATRFIFGMLPPANVCKLPENKVAVISELFPLPFWWGNQDRV